uniref:Fungal-type protein kinase domain-containing protein n=1 Tax=Ganoderma boninense TaxID=34458 RepID=A0A5K1K774_9APHY|nr:Uncharacterized protein [Ganoderma boninense]
MHSRFHQLGVQAFNALLPGSSPTASDQARFFSPEITNQGMSERAIGIELQDYQAKGNHNKRSNTVNDIGIYVDTEAARRVTTLTSQDVIKSKLTREELATGDFGHDTQADDGESEERPPLSVTDASDDDVAGSADNFEDEEEDVPLGPSIDVAEGKPCIRMGPKGESGLGQLRNYMHNLCAAQHRLFCYGFYVQWRWARLLYFDRTGALVSEPFDWTTPSSPLHDFVWKFAHMTPERRGYDPTAQEASYDEKAEVFMAARSESLPVAIQPYIQKAFLWNDKPADHSGKDRLVWGLDEAPIHRLTVTSAPPSPDDVFPDSAPTPPTADALDTSEHVPYSWRPLVPGQARPEHLVYERLRTGGVAYCIATLVCGGDVGGPMQQTTETHSYFPESERPVPRVHYRIVTEEIGLPLTEFANFGELNTVFLDAVLGHYTAWEKAGILHRDISVGNILIHPVTRRGILIDWDLSRLRSGLEQGPVEPDRTGTWQFRSALSLAFPRKPYRLSDDIESFVHTYRWIVLRFHKTSVPDLRTFVQTEFEHSTRTVLPGVRLGGQQKLITMSVSESTFHVRDNARLQGLLDELAAGCFSHYRQIDQGRMEELYGVPFEDPQPPSQSEPAFEPELAPAEDSDLDNSDAFNDMMNRMMQALPSTPVPGERVPEVVQPLHYGLQPLADPCDVNGFLSVHVSLANAFRKWKRNVAPRQEDQFLLRFAQDLPDSVVNTASRGVESMSRSETHDSKEQFPSSSSSSSNNRRKKRRRNEDDGDEAGTATPASEGDDATTRSCPTEVQVPKRQKKTRTRV